MGVEIVTKYPDLFVWIFSVAMSALVFTLVYYIKKSDKNNSRQWDTFTSHETRLSRIEGRCESYHNGK